MQFVLGNVPASGLPFLAVSLSAATNSLASIGFPACDAINAAASLFLLGPASLSIPSSAGLIGTQSHLQGAVIEPVSASFGLGLSGVVTLTVAAQ